MKKLIWLLLLLAGTAFAQPYPNKTIRVAVAFPPGGPVDIIARLLGPKLSDSLGQSVVVENVVGAGGNMAATRVAKSPPDGYTILAHSSAYAVNPTLIPNAGYDGEKDFIALAIVASQPNFIVVHADFPAKTLAELLARAKTDKLAFASAGNGTTPHLTGENLFKLRAKVDITHIPFKGGGPAAAGGAGRAAAGGRDRRLGAAAAYQGRQDPRARGIRGAPRGRRCPTCRRSASWATRAWRTTPGSASSCRPERPPDIAQKLNDAIVRAANDPEIKERMEALAFDVTAAPLRRDRRLCEERAREVGQGGARGRR